jgi:hypothetical protein
MGKRKSRMSDGLIPETRPPPPACPDTRGATMLSVRREEEVTKKVGPAKRPQLGEMIACRVTAACSSARPSDRRS